MNKRLKLVDKIQDQIYDKGNIWRDKESSSIHLR